MAAILIIDDDPVFSDMTKQRLERAGHRVTVHIGPFGATVSASKPWIDLVILDIFMPALDGPQVLKLIRSGHTKFSGKVVFCSSMDPEPLAEIAGRHQADGWIPKSADRAKFLKYVAEVLRGDAARAR